MKKTRRGAASLEIGKGSGLVETLYSRKVQPAMVPKSLRRKRLFRMAKRKPTHYKLVCISLYNRDIEKLEDHVQSLKRKGHTKASKSQVIRFAIDKVAVEKMPRVY